jgi:hypothetical protein
MEPQITQTKQGSAVFPSSSSGAHWLLPIRSKRDFVEKVCGNALAYDLRKRDLAAAQERGVVVRL